MRKTLAEFTFGTWTAPEAAIAVEFPLEIMDELRLAALGGLRQLARGGLEIGGVLFGSRRENLVRVINWRSIPCEHARGPALLLSDKDRDGLKTLLAQAEDEIDLRGLQPVGFFVSHTRSEVALGEADQEIFEQFFPESWQVALVLRPQRGGDCRAGFFVREDGKLLRTESSYHEFTVEPLSEPAAPAGEPANSASPERGPALVRTSRAPNPPLPARADNSWEPPKIAPARLKRAGSRWIWAIPGLLALVLVGAIVRDRFRTLPQKPISLRLQQHGDQMTLTWDSNSPAVQGAFGGSLEIQDGAGDQHLELSRQQLRNGVLNYTRMSGDMQATLILRLTGGATAREVARYVGPVGLAPPPMDAETIQLRRDRDRLLAENSRLKDQARRNALRAENAEGQVRVLQRRLKALASER